MAEVVEARPTKVCRVCGQRKPLHEFPITGISTPDGRQPNCGPCHIAKVREGKRRANLVRGENRREQPTAEGGESAPEEKPPSGSAADGLTGHVWRQMLLILAYGFTAAEKQAKDDFEAGSFEYEERMADIMQAAGRLYALMPKRPD